MEKLLKFMMQIPDGRTFAAGIELSKTGPEIDYQFRMFLESVYKTLRIEVLGCKYNSAEEDEEIISEYNDSNIIVLGTTGGLYECTSEKVEGAASEGNCGCCEDDGHKSQSADA